MEGLGRVGSAAVDAKVNFNELERHGCGGATANGSRWRGYR